jgi:NAD(P)-dependent dehydrogenase (short-subunit alcohol dehydrogenase family)
MRLKGKVALITGAAQGIGLSVAELFAREGAALVLNDWNGKAGRQVVRRLQAQGYEVQAVIGDVSRPRVARRLVDTALAQWGRVDILVNNAGVGGSAHGDGPVTESKQEAWDTILRVNLKSVFLCCRYAIPEMIRSGSGAIINVASVLGLVGCREHFTSHAYVASKGGMLSLTRALAAYYARQHVRVNTVCPGLIKTPLTAKSQRRRRVLRYVAQRQPLVGGLGTPQEVASAILFLASDEARFITGAVLPVDAGWSTGV